MTFRTTVLSIMTLSITNMIATFSIMALGISIEYKYAEPTSSC